MNGKTASGAPTRPRTLGRSRFPFQVPRFRKAKLAISPFTLKLRVVDRARLHIEANGPAGHAEADAPLPEVRPISRVVADGDSKPWKLACQSGEKLFKAVFAPPILQLFRASLAQTHGEPLSIVIDSDLELEDLPWELLRDSERERFLALST